MLIALREASQDGKCNSVQGGKEGPWRRICAAVWAEHLCDSDAYLFFYLLALDPQWKRRRRDDGRRKTKKRKT